MEGAKRLKPIAMKSVSNLGQCETFETDFNSGNNFLEQSQIAPKRYVVYLRVSTQRQGESGLGLEAQRQAVTAYLSWQHCEVIAEYTEIESGKRSDRPELQRALSECRRKKATLVIAKLDRLARNVLFIAGMMEAGVEFIAVDNPHANRLLLHMLAAFAEHEREQISKRTKEALAAAKIRGVKLGANGSRLAEKYRNEANDRARIFYPMIRALIIELRSYGAVAQKWNAAQVQTACGGRWHASSVRGVYLRGSHLGLAV